MAQTAAKPQTGGGRRRHTSTETTEAATTTRSRKRAGGGGVGNIRTTHVQLLFVVFSCSYIIIIKALNCFVVFSPARVAMLGEERRERHDWNIKVLQSPWVPRELSTTLMMSAIIIAAVIQLLLLYIVKLLNWYCHKLITQQMRKLFTFHQQFFLFYYQKKTFTHNLWRTQTCLHMSKTVHLHISYALYMSALNIHDIVGSCGGGKRDCWGKVACVTSSYAAHESMLRFYANFVCLLCISLFAVTR